MPRTKKAAWNDLGWIALGDEVICCEAPEGEKIRGWGRPAQWLRGGATGRIIEAPRKGYPAHRCPDHEEFPDCVCGDEGTIGEQPAWAVVDWDLDGGGTHHCAIRRDEEGTLWKRAK